MKTIMLDGSLYRDAKELHLALKRMLSLPDWYGMNADALNDCLSERAGTVNLWIADPGSGCRPWRKRALLCGQLSRQPAGACNP